MHIPLIIVMFVFLSVPFAIVGAETAADQESKQEPKQDSVQEAAPAEEVQVTLAACMEIINDAYKQVRREVRAGREVSSFTLVLLAEAKKAAVLAQSPDLYPATLTAAENQEEMLALYTEQMQQLVDQTNALYAAAQSKDHAKLQELIASMNELKKAGHKAFMPDEE